MTTLSQTPFGSHPSWTPDLAQKSNHLSLDQLRQSYDRTPLFGSMVVLPMRQYGGQPALFFKRETATGFLLISRRPTHARLAMRKLEFHEWALYFGHIVN